MSLNTNRGSAKSGSTLAREAEIIQRKGVLTLILHGFGHGIGHINKIGKGECKT